MLKTLRRDFMFVNTLLIFILLCAALLAFYFVSWIRMEQSTTNTVTRYMSTPINDVRREVDHPRLFISTIDVGTYEYIQGVVDSNIFKYFDTLYANDSFSTSQTNRILARVAENPDYVSTIHVDERHYKYVRQQTDGGAIKIAVLDITSVINNLRSTRNGLLIIASTSLVFIFFVSKLITDRSIKPLEAMLARQVEFFSDISHELKTPLTIAITNLAVIESHKEQTVESQAKWMGFLKEQLNRLSTLVNEMLFLESMTFDDPCEEIEHIDFSSLLERHIKSMRAVMKQRELVLKEDIQSAVHLYADREAMTRLISVLIDNAIKYTPGGGTITVSLSQSARRMVFSVKNTGDGIEPEDIDRIFDRLYRVRKSRSTNEGGKGLGLAIGKSVVERYNGTISVESELGEYTTFTVVLPIGPR